MESILTALITGGITLLGVLIANSKSQAVVETKVEELTREVREHFGAPALPSSGVRCPEHNKEVGGVWNSFHLAGKALDFRIQGRSAAEVLAFVKTLPVHYAYAIDGSYVHMDVT